MLSITNSPISPSSSVGCELHNEDSWVVVKKQKITVLIPPDRSQTVTTLPSTAEPITAAENKKKKKHAGEITAIPQDLPPPTMLPLLTSKGRRRGEDQPLMPVGALSLAKKRLRAHNLERRLRELGGLRKWLMAYEDLRRFAEAFDRKKIGMYQLANGTDMSVLRDMGFAPVGPRRKLICEIDRLCQPFCFSSCDN